MLGRIRSALFIDFENVALPPDAIPNWLPWLEDGVFDHGKRRRFILKRVYWNSSAQKHEPAYKASGFEVVHCDRYVGLTNSVDVRMAIDIVEATYQYPRIEEYILVTKDSDFVPVLRRLRELHKRTAFLVDEKRPNVHTIYRAHADTLISLGSLSEARRYVRPRPGLLERLLAPSTRASPPPPAATRRPSRPPVPAEDPGASLPPPQPAPQQPPARPSPPPRLVETPPPEAASETDVLPSALRHVLRLVEQRPRKLTSKSLIVDALRAVPSFALSGRGAYLGAGNYEGLMRRLSALDPRLVIEPQNGGGFAIKFMPDEAPAAAPATSPLPSARSAPPDAA